jgi:GNAT superfamily N-acetyltransferase
MSGERELIVEPIGKHHNRSDFSCGYEALDQYLQKQATQDARRMVAAPFILTRESDRKTVIGYYTLSAFGVSLQDLPNEVVKKLPAYPIVPVTLLGRLALDQRYRGQGLGEFLLVDALKRALKQSSQIAAAAVVVDAIDEKSAGFYRHFEFINFPDKPGRLFLPMKTIASLLTSS